MAGKLLTLRLRHKRVRHYIASEHWLLTLHAYIIIIMRTAIIAEKIQLRRFTLFVQLHTSHQQNNVYVLDNFVIHHFHFRNGCIVFPLNLRLLLPVPDTRNSEQGNVPYMYTGYLPLTSLYSYVSLHVRLCCTTTGST